MQEYLLGIDIGTSSCKVAAFDYTGKLIAQESESYQVYYPQDGWAEQNPLDWWRAICSCTQNILRDGKIKPTDIVGIGIDGQGWAAIPLDKEKNLLHNTPIWMDTRAKDICDRLNRDIGAEKIFQISGNPLQPSYTLPKILWYKEMLPELYEKIDKVLQSNSYIAFMLTGEITQDPSQGYGLQCYDIKKGSWDQDLCRELGIDPGFLPEIFPSHQVIGKVNQKAAKETGLRAGTPVVAGGLDAACGTLGAGVINDGQTQEQGGQAGGMSICMDTYRADPRLILTSHVVPGKWLLQGGTVGGGGVLKWFKEEFGFEERNLEGNTFDLLGKKAAAITPGSDGMIFLPYMSGERSPIWDANAKGVYYGIDFSKTKGHFIRASLEGVAYSLKHNIDIAEEVGAKVSELRAMGGAANSQVWTQIKADVTGKTIKVSTSDTATTLGAAILAGVGVGVYKSFEEAVEKTVTVTKKYSPNINNNREYNIQYKTYLQLYKDLKGIMNQ